MRALNCIFALALAAAALAGCSRTPHPIPAENEVPIYELIDDPLESMNRCTSAMNRGVFRYFLYPFNRGYEFVVPAPVRRSISKFGTNLAFPQRAINTALQGKFGQTWDETMRFGVNTTVGIVGLFDPATKWGIPIHREDFGQTFGHYGGDPGFYLELPLMGPSSGRDALGRLLDYPFNVASWFIGARPFFANNDASFNSHRYKQLIDTTSDPYSLLRNLWAVDREKDVLDYVPAQEPAAAEASMTAIFLAPRDPKFRGKGKTRRVVVPSTGRELPYTYWVQPQKAPWVLILPGLGGHRISGSSVALAEMVYRNGYSAVTISSTMNPEFMNAAATTPVPGFPPADCVDLIHAMRAIREDLMARHPQQASSAAVMGLSLGAIQTLFLATYDQQQRIPDFKFDRYLAINPPPDLFYALSQLDRFSQAPLQTPPPDRWQWMVDTLMKAVVMGRGEITPTEPIPLTLAESEFLIGVDFRYILRDVIYQGQRREDLGVLAGDLHSVSRRSAYAAIWKYDYTGYMNNFALPYYQARPPESLAVAGQGVPKSMTAEQLVAAASPKSLEAWLRTNPEVRVHTNANDFLLKPEDLEWFKATLGERLVLFEGGGHLGNLFLPDVQDRILKSLADMRNL